MISKLISLILICSVGFLFYEVYELETKVKILSLDCEAYRKNNEACTTILAEDLDKKFGICVQILIEHQGKIAELEQKKTKVKPEFKLWT